MRDWRCSSTHL